MKKFVLPFILSLSLLVSSCSTDLATLNPFKMASTTQETVKDIKSYNDEVFDEIQHNIDLVENLKKRITTASQLGKPMPLDEVIKEITKVTESYEKLSGKKDSIRANFNNKIKVIRDMQTSVNDKIKDLRNKSADYNHQIQTLPTTTNDVEIIRTRTKALTQANNYVNTQIKLWIEFNNLEQGIHNEVTSVEQRENDFLSVIDSSAILFREALNLLELQRNLNDALALFTVDMPTAQKLTQDMERSWGNLDYLVTSLTSLTANMEVTP